MTFQKGKDSQSKNHDKNEPMRQDGSKNICKIEHPKLNAIKSQNT